MATPGPNHALDHESRRGEIIAILSVASILSTLAVALRCYSRAVILRSFGLDDAIMVPAQMLTLGSAVAIGLESKYGLGRHVWMMPEGDYVPYMKSFYSSIVVYNVAVCMTKISILLQYRRIFNNTMLRKVIVVGLAFLICWGTTLSFLLTMVCMPVAKFWDDTLPGFCLDNLTIWYVMAGVNVFTDFAVFTMPIPVISSLQLPKKQKAMLLIVFTLGIFPCAVSIYRIKTLGAASKSADPTWDNVDAATFSFLELSVGVIAVCLPTIRPALIRAMPRIFGSLLRSHTGQSGRGVTSGRPSRNTYGQADGGSRSHPSAFKSALRESESTEGLRPEDLRATSAPRSRMEQDIEFGELESSARQPAGGPRRYSVSVVAGWEPQAGSDLALGGVGRPGIKTTTIVTQRVSFAAGESAGSSANSSPATDEKRGL